MKIRALRDNEDHSNTIEVDRHILEKMWLQEMKEASLLVLYSNLLLWVLCICTQVEQRERRISVD